MPTEYDYERECNEIDEELNKYKRNMITKKQDFTDENWINNMPLSTLNKIRKEARKELIEEILEWCYKNNTMEKESKWIYIRNNEVRAIFDNRKEAVSYFKELLKQTLKNFDKQDKNSEFDYPMTIPLQEFKPVEYRPTHLSLL